jgi:transcription initiation factor TFIIE subunit alpha
LIRVESQQEELGNSFYSLNTIGKQDGFITIGPDSAAAKRKVSKSYYFLDYKQFIDVVKWKMHKINKMYLFFYLIKRIESSVSEQALHYSYKCPVCEKTYQGLDVIRLVMTADGFQCDLCESLIQEAERSEQASSASYIKFMEETQPLLDLLKKTDTLILPEYVLSFMA